MPCGVEPLEKNEINVCKKKHENRVCARARNEKYEISAQKKQISRWCVHEIQIERVTAGENVSRCRYLRILYT